MSIISERYAGAFLEAAGAQGKQEDCLSDLNGLKELFETNEAFVSFLKNPKVKKFEKQDFLKKVFQGKVEDLTLNCLLLMLDKGRIAFVPEVAEDYKRLLDEQKNVISMTITTAFPAEQELVDQLKAKFQKQYNAEDVKVELNVDPDIIGGAIIVVGDTMYDESVRGKLNALQAAINAV